MIGLAALGNLAKMAKGGGLGPDQLAALCEAVGMKVKLTEVPAAGIKEAILSASAPLTRQGSKLVRISGRMENGDTMEALIILAPAPAEGAGRLLKTPLTTVAATL